MAEENQVTKEPQQVTQVTKEAQRVTTKNPKKVEVGKRLAEHNHRRREEKKWEQAKLENSGVNQYYRIGAVIALGVVGGLGYYIYQSKKGEQPWGRAATTCPQGPSSSAQQNNPQAQLQTNKFEMD